MPPRRTDLSLSDKLEPLPSGCVRWLGQHNSDGRPVVKIRALSPANLYVAVYLWEREHGPKPPAHDLHHTCTNKWCVNVAHLEPLTHAAHLALHQVEICKRGHRYEEANIYRHRGKRYCRACKVIRERERRAA